jgi:putative ABC transport system permease protein
MTPQDEDPPRLAERLLRRFVPPGIAGLSILGDAREEYLEHRQSCSRPGAALWYWKHVLSLVVRFAGRRRHTVPAARAGMGVRVNNLLLDVRLALRLVRRNPMFAAAAVLTLGLGIGANTTIFSLVDTVLLQPLPYPAPERLMSVYREDPEVTGRNPAPANIAGLFAVPYAVFLDWTARSRVFQDAGAYAPARFVLTGGERPVPLTGLVATSGVFSTLGVRPALGRALVSDDDRVGAGAVAILSHGLWQGRFGADPEILGHEVTLSDTSFTVVGVMPPGFSVLGGGNEEVWTNLNDQRKQSPVRNSGYLQVIARLKPEFSVEQGQAELDSVSRQIGEDHPEEREHRILLVPRKALVVANARPGLIMLMGAVGLVLLIACANIANLLLVRATERRREFGIRQALGAGRGRLVFQQLVETLVITSAGGALGCLIAALTLEPLAAAYPGGLARVAEVTVDIRLLAFSAVLTIATAFVTSALPALRIVGTAAADMLREGGRSLSGSRFRNRVQATLIVSEIALAFVLLAGAGLFIRSYAALGASDLGFEGAHLITMRVDVPSRYADGGNEAAAAFDADVTTRLLDIPGVESAGGADQSPFIGGMSFPPTSIETAEGITRAITFATTITPGYFAALGAPIIEGRGFDGRDRPGTQPVVIVNQTMAERYWPGLDPIGRRVRFEFGGRVWMTVVGVVRDVVYRLGQRPPAAVYVPTAHFPDSNLYFVARVSATPDRIIPPVRALLQELDPQAAVTVYSLAERIGNSDAAVSQRFGIALMGCLAAVAALLAIVGIYGVLSYSVSLRAHEIGIRMALGAGATDVVGGVLGRSLLMAALGCAAGLALATAASRVLGSLLYEISPTDPATMAGVGLLVTTAAALAAYGPARRATRVSPVEVLRQDG